MIIIIIIILYYFYDDKDAIYVIGKVIPVQSFCYFYWLLTMNHNGRGEAAMCIVKYN